LGVGGKEKRGRKKILVPERETSTKFPRVLNLRGGKVRGEKLVPKKKRRNEKEKKKANGSSVHCSPKIGGGRTPGMERR